MELKLEDKNTMLIPNSMICLKTVNFSSDRRNVSALIQNFDTSQKHVENIPKFRHIGKTCRKSGNLSLRLFCVKKNEKFQHSFLLMLKNLDFFNITKSVSYNQIILAIL